MKRHVTTLIGLFATVGLAVAMPDATGTGLAPGAVDDFDGNGVSDLLWRNARTGENQVWLEARSGTRRGTPNVLNTDWRIVGTGDYDGDGTSDVFWRNGTTGANAMWPGALPARTPLRGWRTSPGNSSRAGPGNAMPIG